jgi:peptidyl-prolyl cis-trans isomerase C
MTSPMTSSKARLALLPLLACAALACKSKQNAQHTGPVVARIGDEVITADDFKKKLDETSPFLRARYNTAERKKEFLENLIKNELLAQEAMRRGLDKSPAVQEVIKRAAVQELLRQQLDEKLTGADIADADLRKFYEQHLEDYVKPERVRINHLLIATGPGAQGKASRLLREISDRESKGEVNAFQVVAMKESADPKSAPVGGDVRYLSKVELSRELGDAVAEASFTLAKAGDKAGPLETPRGFELIKLQNRTIALDKKFDDVKDMLRQRMARERRSQEYDAFMKRLRADGRVTIMDDEIAKLPNPEAGQGMSFPGMQASPPRPPPSMQPSPSRLENIARPAQRAEAPK